MKTLVIYYSYTGNTRRLAEQFASKHNAEIFEIKDIKRPGTIGAYTSGCYKALRHQEASVQPILPQLESFEKLVIFSPVWAGYTVPAINAVLNRLPAGKPVELYMISYSGSTNASAESSVRNILEGRGCTLAKFENIKR